MNVPTDGSEWKTLSATLERIDGHDIGKHPLVVKVMQGIFNSNPPQPKYSGFWDASLVLTHLEGLGVDASLSLSCFHLN